MGPSSGRLKAATLALLLLAGSAVVTAAETQVPKQTAGVVLVNQFDVIHTADGVEIEIGGNGPMKTRTLRLPNPERFVIDVQDSVLTAKPHTVQVETGGIVSVRIGPLYSREEQVTRVVVHLAAAADMEVRHEQDGLRVRLRSSGIVGARAAPPAAPVDSTEQPHAIPEAPRGTAVTTLSAAGQPGGEDELLTTARETLRAETDAINPAHSSVPPPAPSAEESASIAEIAPNVPTVLPEQVAEALATVAKEDAAATVIAMGTGITGIAEDKLLGSDAQPEEPKIIKRPRPNLAAREEPPPFALNLSGTASTGYQRTDTRAGYISREASPVGSLSFDTSGYFHSPGFLNFSVKPQGSVGRQSSEGIFPDGDGVSATATFLRAGVTPLTVFYNRLNRKLVTFGPLDRLAGLDANTFQDSLGANWRLRSPRFPEIGLSFSKYADRYEPLAARAPKTANAGRLLSAELSQKVLGWNLASQYKVERASQDLINIFDPTQAPYVYNRKNQETRFSADREVGDRLNASFVAASTHSRNEVQSRPFDQSFRFLSGNSFVRASKKLTLALRAGISDNVVGAALERLAGNDAFAPERPFLLLPSTARVQMINYFGSAQYAVSTDLRVHADALRETTRAPQSGTLSSPSSALTSMQAGIAYSHRFRWVQLQSHYAANGGRFAYASTGSNRSYGHRANMVATFGSLRSIEVSAGVQGSLQDVTGNTYVYDRNWGANLTLSRSLFETWKLRATYDRQRDQYRLSGSEVRATGNGINIALVHPRVEFSASHHLREGLSFQADPRLQYLSAGQGSILLGVFPETLVAPTGAAWSSATLAFRPLSKVLGRFRWMRSRQSLQGAIRNFYTEWEASAGYQFRSMTIDAGYVLHDQNFAFDLFERNRFFFRVVREFTIF